MLPSFALTADSRIQYPVLKEPLTLGAKSQMTLFLPQSPSQSVWGALGAGLAISALVRQDYLHHCLLSLLTLPPTQLAHHIFRKYETFCLPLHAGLVLLPPAIAASYFISARGDTLSPFLTITFSYVAYLGALSTSVILYRLSPFHPLHVYPGPFWSRTSMFWHAMRTTTGQQMRDLQTLHEQYGDVVRIGTPNLDGS